MRVAFIVLGLVNLYFSTLGFFKGSLVGGCASAVGFLICVAYLVQDWLQRNRVLGVRLVRR